MAFDVNIDNEFHDFVDQQDAIDNAPFYLKAESEKLYDQEEDYDALFGDINFSEMSGDFNSNLRSISSRSRVQVKPKLVEHHQKRPIISQRQQVQGQKVKENKISKVIVPSSKKVIVEGVSKFILSQDKTDNWVKSIGYKDGKKLKELVLTFNNTTSLDFEIELFNPSAPLDYLYSTSLNLNDQIVVAGGTTKYSDVLFNLLANPAKIFASKFVVSGPNIQNQINQPLQIINRNIAGVEKISPHRLSLDVDTQQFKDFIIYFDLEKTLNRPFIPDGMDILKYKILAGHTVTFGFYYNQISLKKFFYPEAAASKNLL